MNCKRVFAALLPLFIFVNPGCQDIKESHQPQRDRAAANKAVTNNQADGESIAENTYHAVAAYYFHRTYRCPSCLAIEALSLEALQTGFGQLLEDSTLEWRAINIDDPGGEDFVKDFNLETSSLVIVETVNGEQVRWKKLDNVWELKDDRDAFVKYVQDEVAAYLAGD